MLSRLIFSIMFLASAVVLSGCSEAAADESSPDGSSPDGSSPTSTLDCGEGCQSTAFSPKLVEFRLTKPVAVICYPEIDSLCRSEFKNPLYGMDPTRFSVMRHKECGETDLSKVVDPAFHGEDYYVNEVIKARWDSDEIDDCNSLLIQAWVY